MNLNNEGEEIKQPDGGNLKAIVEACREIGVYTDSAKVCAEKSRAWLRKHARMAVKGPRSDFDGRRGV